MTVLVLQTAGTASSAEKEPWVSVEATPAPLLLSPMWLAALGPSAPPWDATKLSQEEQELMTQQGDPRGRMWPGKETV